MKRLWTHTLCAAGLALSWAVQAALAPGDTAPSFTAPASLAGQAAPFSLEEALQHGPVVLYFYPSAYTKGCNLQARLFSERHEQFRAAGASVVGVSLDSIERLKTFSADPEYCAGKLRVASDSDGSIAKAFGLTVRPTSHGIRDTRGAEIDHGFVERTTFIIGRDGRIAATISGVSPADNVAQSLQAVQALASLR